MPAPSHFDPELVQVARASRSHLEALAEYVGGCSDQCSVLRFIVADLIGAVVEINAIAYEAIAHWAIPQQALMIEPHDPSDYQI